VTFDVGLLCAVISIVLRSDTLSTNYMHNQVRLQPLNSVIPVFLLFLITSL